MALSILGSARSSRDLVPETSMFFCYIYVLLLTLSLFAVVDLSITDSYPFIKYPAIYTLSYCRLLV